MKKIIPYLTLLFMMLNFSFCKTQEYTPTDFPKQQIIFGSGGGMTGAVTEYALLENGSLFSKKGMTANYQAYAKADKTLATQLFKNIDVLQLKEIKVNNPGNRYFYVTLKDKSGEHQIMWNNPESIPNKLKTFYDILNHLTKVKM